VPNKKKKWPFSVENNEKNAYCRTDVEDPDSDMVLSVPRVKVLKGSKRNYGFLSIRCGCCKEKVKVGYFSKDGKKVSRLEINGVIASARAWKEILGLNF
jgi:hypothetical protein